MQGSLIYSIQLKFHHRRLNEWWMKDECNPEQKSLSEKNEILSAFVFLDVLLKILKKFLSDGGEKNFIGTKDWKKQSELDWWIKLKLNAEGSNPPLARLKKVSTMPLLVCWWPIDRFDHSFEACGKIFVALFGFGFDFDALEATNVSMVKRDEIVIEDRTMAHLVFYH